MMEDQDIGRSLTRGIAGRPRKGGIGTFPHQERLRKGAFQDRSFAKEEAENFFILAEFAKHRWDVERWGKEASVGTGVGKKSEVSEQLGQQGLIRGSSRGS